MLAQIVSHGRSILIVDTFYLCGNEKEQSKNPYWQQWKLGAKEEHQPLQVSNMLVSGF